MYMYIVCDRIWENPTFCIFHQNWDFAISSSVTSVLNMSIYNPTISELQRFVMQPLLRGGGGAFTPPSMNFAPPWNLRTILTFMWLPPPNFFLSTFAPPWEFF